jgi:hypothetical protein
LKLAVATGRKEHAARINEAWQKGVGAVIETGLRIIDARDGLEHGEFEKMVRNDLHVSPGTARKLLAIASNKVIANRSHVNDLPASWGTLYELTSAENKGLDLEAGIASGAIHPKMERKDVKALLPQRDDDLEDEPADDEPVADPLQLRLQSLEEAWLDAGSEVRRDFVRARWNQIVEARDWSANGKDHEPSKEDAADRWIESDSL